MIKLPTSARRCVLGTAVAVLVFPLLPSCSHYQIVRDNSLGISSIAIGPVQNLTDEPRLAVYMKRMLAERITHAGSMQLRAPDDAEAILTATIVSYTTQGIGETKIDSPDEDREKYRSSVFRLNVEIDFSVTLANGDVVLIPVTRVSGRAEYSELVDTEIVKQDAFERAIYAVSADIIDRIVAP